jgi:nucleotide-binding universal stress UspA family protein
MKTILLPIVGDSGMEGRLESALSLARDQKAHLSCYQILPIPYVLWSGEASGMNYGLMLRDAEGAAKDLRTETEATLSKEGVPWDWHVRTGDPVGEIILAARLADMIIVGSGSEDDAPPLHIAADLSFHVPIPVLAIPINGAPLDPSGPMVIAWNGSAEAANALRNSLPLISSASSVHLVTIDNGDAASAFPAEDAGIVLSRHGIQFEIKNLAVGTSVEETLEATAHDINAACIVMGAYGHSRTREMIFGGVTRHMLGNSAFPLLLSH